MVTKPKPDSELVNLVYGCTAVPAEGNIAMYQRPMFWAVIVAMALVIANIIFW
jgi:SSS family solute:Na+ symporter